MHNPTLFTFRKPLQKEIVTVTHTGSVFLKIWCQVIYNRILTKVKLIQQDLSACRHPDSTRTYLVSGHDRIDQPTGAKPRVSPWWPRSLPVWDQHHQHCPPVV